MTHLSDKELDRLSRDASEQFDVNQNTSGWDRLEQMLDREMPVEDEKKRRPFFFLLLFLTLIGGSGLISLLIYTPESQPKNNQPKTITDGNLDNPVTQTPILRNGDSNPALNQEKRISPEERRGAPTTINKHKIPDHITTYKNDLAGRTNRSRPVDSKMPGSQISLIANTKRKSQNKSEKENQIFRTITNEQKDISLNADGIKNAMITSLAMNEPGSVKSPSANIGSTWLNEQMFFNRNIIKSRQSIQTETLSKNANPESQSEKGFSLGISGGPDKSNVNFNTNAEDGINVGIIAGYRLSKKWSLNTGIIYTKKAYTALGKDFYPPKTGWFNSIEISSVEGDCIMIDIPINLRYNIITFPKTRMFISTGLSTYFMTRETYDYHYTYGGVYGRREMIYNDKKIHPLAVINVSAGIEQALYRKIALQVEPFLKTPFNGVGFGNIKLNSIGAYLSLKYNW